MDSAIEDVSSSLALGGGEYNINVPTNAITISVEVSKVIPNEPLAFHAQTLQQHTKVSIVSSSWALVVRETPDQPKLKGEVLNWILDWLLIVAAFDRFYM